MARKNIVASYAMIDAQDGLTDFDSSIVNVQNMDKASISIFVDGGSVGFIRTQARNGADQPWYDLDINGGAGPITIQTNEPSIIVLNELPFTDIKLNYVADLGNSLGPGTVTAAITMKQVGG